MNCVNCVIKASTDEDCVELRPVTSIFIDNIVTHFHTSQNNALKMAAKMAAIIGNHYRVVNYWLKVY